MKHFFICSTAILVSTSLNAVEYSGWISLQNQGFGNKGLRDQAQYNLSIAAQAEAFTRLNDQWEFTGEFFIRLDQEDSERSHLDIREAHILGVYDSWEYKIGISKEYWGATEFAHLVDVINQTDAVENLDGEDKLGQLMLKASWFNKWGSIEAFVLPGLRERTFTGKDGRFHFSPLLIDTDNASYESSAEEWHTDLALRFNGSFSSMDLGLAVFTGTNRDPSFNPGSNGKLIPHYEQMTQTSVDMTIPTGDWLWKAEARHRDSDADSFAAASGGFEYTMVGIFDSAKDLGIILEYIWDERDDEAETFLQSDLFLGGRLAFNNIQETEVLFGIVHDVDGGGDLYNVELNHRLNDAITVEIQARAFINTESDDPLHALRDDDYLQVEFTYYF